ncbi:hypothetical protein EK21DRAFT_116870 [Setomelanomma holmii]|uniref:USP domain-containing protein n=1 Tax=Setomelanomma holmii TaxID=210430 RepID=A0A9P4GYU7_9PLEO|nr:hypothetical protein EK21DRAFT_116870 [Setomelanomma holmii]
MNARDHDLAHFVAADEPAITVSASPPRRDPVEDADPSFTRKRPRLDSGSNSTRALSTDTESPSHTAPSSREQQVEMTIRSLPPSSPVHADSEDGHDANDALGEPQDMSPVLLASTEDDLPSPPVIAIDDDDDEAEAGFSVQPDAEDHFQRFPFERLGNYSHIVREIPQYLSGSQPIDGSILPALTNWLKDLPEPSDDIHGFYTSKTVFWDDFGTLVNKVLSRRYQWMSALNKGDSNDPNRFPFGEQFDDGQTDFIFYSFLSAYARVCSFLIYADVHVLSQLGANETYPLPLISHKHIRYLHNIIRSEKSPVFHVLHKEYNTDIQDMVNRLHKDFLGANGAQNLFQLMDKSFHKIPADAQNLYAQFAAPLFSSLGWTIFELPGRDTIIDRSEFLGGTLTFFEQYSEDLQDPAKPIDAGVARDLIQYYSTLVHELCQWDDSIAAKLVDKFLDFGDPNSPTSSSPETDLASITVDDYLRSPACFPALIMNSWKFKILRKYIVKGNMGMRVMGIATMDSALVEIWREYNNIDPSCRHPVMQYLADFLLKGQVVDYIVSVDSHPQLISRSGNIVGFLVVTHRWSDHQADAIWRTVATSPDPRVVSATMTMLRGIIGLMEPWDRQYLCTKLHDLPIERYTQDILRFLRDLTVRPSEPMLSIDERGPTGRPWNVCIRMIRDTAPSRDTDNVLLDLHSEAIDQLRVWTNMIPSTERQSIYSDSAEQIASRATTATGNFKVICMLMQYPYPADTPFFQQHQDLIRSVLEEIPAFVKSELESSTYQCRMQALQYRLDFLMLTISHPEIHVPVDLFQDLMEHTIGKFALSNDARDLAWARLIDSIKMSPENHFCKQLVTSFIPTMAAKQITPGMFEFVASYKFPISREAIDTLQGGRMLLQIPGADLLWKIILSAPHGTIEDRAALSLASRYVQIVHMDGITIPEVEQSHTALVKKCIKELRAAIEISMKPSKEIYVVGNFDFSDDASAQQHAETLVARILMFQKTLLGFVRRTPQFNRKRVDSKVDAMELDDVTGDAVIVRYQCGNDRQGVTMGSEHTLDDLYRRLCHESGHTKVNLFAKGQRLNILEKGTCKLSEFDFGGQVIVQRADGAETTRPTAAPVIGTSAFESAVAEHFDELFAWMDSDDKTSALLFDFLRFFPARSSFADSVTHGEVLSMELFPPGKAFQSQYAALALKERLQEQLRSSTIDEIFLRNAVQRLEKGILGLDIADQTNSTPQHLQLAAVLVTVLLEFLRERPSCETSASYFSDGPALVNQLMRVVLVGLTTKRFETATVVTDAYATIVEASLHSRTVWDAYKEHPDVQAVLKQLLLSHTDEVIREHVFRKISSIFSGDLPFTCPITKGEFAAHFWTVLSAILPDVVQYPTQSEQIFQLSEQVFRVHDEYDRNEEYLRSLLAQWSILLIEHEHKVFPGREEIDHVVLGFTKLLLDCILSIKSFKKPLNAGSLMTQVFKKYILVSSLDDSAASKLVVALPILESHTRQELYNLMLGLAEDSSTYDALLQLAGEAENETTESRLPTNLVDRTMEIRSAVGYVGLYNPRAICYMNSLLTQLFMNVNFRQFILSLDVKEQAGSQRLLHQTQKLFAEMQNMFCRSTDPRDFAACVKSLDKTPIDISIQMDADEFYNLLFDQWEAQLLKQEHKQRFRSFYGGQTLNQIKSKECEHVSERSEPFFAIQCDVQGKANLHDSLQAYVQGDVMEGDNKYKCESCGGKFVDAVKRTCLKNVPDNLILHLKRFEFDLNDFSRRKIYDHFAFPETLDISPYTMEHLADGSKPAKEDVFDLVGVLVHTGTCENGHYYSYIRERPGPGNASSPVWIEFNDSDVGPFNAAEIAERTFGGVMDGDGYTRQTKQFSAYMLFYQRRSAIEDDQSHWMTVSSEVSPKVSVPKAIDEEIAAKNRVFIREYCLFDPAHTRFLRQLHATSRTVNHGTCSEDHKQETRALHIVLAHLCHTAWRHFNADIFMEMFPQLRQSMTTCAECCNAALQWLAADEHALANMFIRCTHPRIRSQMRALMIESLKVLRVKEPTLYGFEGSLSDMDVDLSTLSGGVLVAVVRRLRTTADESKESIRGWDDYYLTLTQLAELGHFETAMLLNHGFLLFCLKFFCLNAFVHFKNEAPELARILEKRRGIYNRMIVFLCKLVANMDLDEPTAYTSQSSDRLPTLNQQSMRFPLTKDEKEVLTWWSEDMKAIAFLDKALEVFDDTKVDHFYPSDIVKWMADTNDLSISANLCNTIVEGIYLEPAYCDAYVLAALPFCEACHKPEHVLKVIIAVCKAISSTSRIAEDRAPSADIVLGFFSSLLTAKNPHVFALSVSGYYFHDHLMCRSKIYGIPLLCHYEEHMRKATYAFLERLYDNDEAVPQATRQMKYASARDLLSALINRFAYEKQAGQSRSFLLPLVETCRMLATQLHVLTQRPDDEWREFQHVNDTALIYQYQREIENRMRTWWHGDETPLSQEEPFDQSDYSESDEPQELLDD